MQRIVEIAALPNGAHRNQTFPGFVPEGWAVIPADMDTPHFPFGEVEAKEIDGVMTVTKWTPGEVPEVPDLVPEPVPEPNLAARVEALEALLEKHGITGGAS